MNNYNLLMNMAILTRVIDDLVEQLSTDRKSFIEFWLKKLQSEIRDQMNDTYED